jgi:hypothetical protein
MCIAFKSSTSGGHASVPYFGCYVPMKILKHVLILLLLFPLQATADQSTPATIAQKYNELFYSLKYSDAFALYDANDLTLTRLILSKSFTGKTSIELKRMVFGERTDKQISELSDSTYLEMFYAATMKRGNSAAVVTVKVIVLGTAYDGNDSAYVTCKNTISMEGNILEAVELVRLKKTNNKWSVGMPSELVGLTDTVAKLSHQSTTDLLTEDAPPEDGEIRILETQPANAVIIGGVDAEFSSTMDNAKEHALQELKRQAYISAADAIMDVKIEEVKIGDTYRIKASAKTLIYKKR